MKNKVFSAIMVFVVLCSFIVASQAYAWTISADFEKGTAGTKAQGLSGFEWAGSTTMFSKENAESGSQSAKLSWQQGTSGYATANGEFYYPTVVGKGSELWIRAYYYFKSPWSWSTPGGSVIKILRSAVKTSGGANAGMLSVFSNTRGQITLSDELLTTNITEFPTGTYFDIDKWQCIEMYIYFSDTNPIFRIWKNGVLVVEDRTKRTLRSSTDVAHMTTMHYWNGMAPQNQTEYVDNFIITTDRPAKRDANGNYMIGPVDGTVAPGTPQALMVR